MGRHRRVRPGVPKVRYPTIAREVITRTEFLEVAMPERSSRRSYSRPVACMILDGDTEYCIDPAEDLLGILGSKWTLAIIGVLGNRPVLRFNDLVAALNGVGSKTLAERLRNLQKLGMVSRQVIPDTPVRIEYRLTEQGRSLRKSLIPLLAWAANYQENPPP